MADTGASLRQAARAGDGRPSAGRVPGVLEAHLVVLPASLAREFVAFCEDNPLACPVLSVGKPGDPMLASLGADIDARTDAPAYLLGAGGMLRPEAELMDVWEKDSVVIALAGWSAAAYAMAVAGIRFREPAPGQVEPTYRSWIPVAPVARFNGDLAVSMRPVDRDDERRASSIAGRIQQGPGAPIHRGHPAHLGVLDALMPDWGEAVPPRSGEECLFWASPVTALTVLEAARLPFFATTAPGCPVVTDIRVDQPRWR